LAISKLLRALPAVVLLTASAAEAQGVVTPDTEPPARDAGKPARSPITSGSATVTSRSMATDANDTVKYKAPGSTASAGPQGNGSASAPGAHSQP
jgi:hypothetical protein